MDERPPPARRRARLTISYRGEPFHGFAVNPGVRTVMGDLTDAVSTIVRVPVDLIGAGRTDAGVHGWGQVVSGDLPETVDLADLARRVNLMCAPSISVRAATWTAADFDARFSATWRRYRYHVWNDPAPNPLVAETTWHVARPLDLAAMRESLGPLHGEHDFSSFCRRPKVAAPGVDGERIASMVRIVYDATWARVDDTPMLRFEVRGSAFCQQMVRSIVGTTVDVGHGRIAAASMPTIIEARDRAVAGAVAPPHGLVLWDVGYDGERWDAATPRQRSADEDATTSS